MTNSLSLTHPTHLFRSSYPQFLSSSFFDCFFFFVFFFQSVRYRFVLILILILIRLDCLLAVGYMTRSRNKRTNEKSNSDATNKRVKSNPTTTTAATTTAATTTRAVTDPATALAALRALTHTMVDHSGSATAFTRLKEYQFDAEILQIAIGRVLNSTDCIRAGSGLAVNSLLAIIAHYAVTIKGTYQHTTTRADSVERWWWDVRSLADRSLISRFV